MKTKGNFLFFMFDEIGFVIFLGFFLVFLLKDKYRKVNKMWIKPLKNPSCVGIFSKELKKS